MPPARPHTFSHTLLTGVALGVLLTATPALTPITAAYANPAGGNVVAGSASFSYNGNTLTVDQHSQRAVIEWQDFSVGAGELTQFLQNNKNAAVLNKVISSLPSSILGQIKANGNVFLVNPNGIVIGKGARIDTNSFVATALNVSSQQFMDGGDMTFSGESAAAVINLGEIHAGNGDIYLIARQVTNEGGLYAPNGEVGLAAGREIYLSTQGVTGSRITVRDDGLAEEIAEHLQDGAAIDNQGVIEAARVVLAARSQDLYDVAINNNGTIRAMGIESNPNGTIRLVATGGGGKITHSGTMTAKNYTGSGGRIEVLGDHITLKSGSLIDVSGTGTADSAPDKATHENRGENGGGTVLIGGDYKGGNDVQTAKSVMIESGATIRANAEGTGDGGKIIVWSDESTEVAGTLEAMGGENGGNGGFIETSSKKGLTIADSVQIHISAPARAIDSEMTNQWRGGQWFLDPEDILIADSGGDISTASINSVLSADGDVTIETDSMAAGNGDITIDNATIVKSGSSGDSELILIADRNIIMTNSSVTVTGGGALSMTFNAAAAGTNDGSIVLDTSSISTNGGAVIMGGGADPTTQAAFGNASYYNNGITIIDSDITTDAGLILMNGQGRGNSGAGNQNGISFVASTLTTTTGTITLNGTGGAGDDDNRGIIMGGSGGVDVVITSAEGAITLTGVGGSNGNDSSVDNYGIHLTADVHITSTGTGAGAATITLNGTGGAGGDANRGVELGGGGTTNTYISSIDGDISITGQGGSNGNSGSNNNFGIRLTNGAYIESTGTTADAATITLDGTGGAGEDNNYGLAIVGSGATSAYVTSAYGAIDITGQGGSNGGGDSSDNYGIYITDGGYISSTGTGANAATITLDATGGAGAYENYGLYIEGLGGSGTYITAIDGAIDITAQGGGDGSESRNYGFVMYDGAYISSSGTGANAATITLNGTGGAGLNDNMGVRINGNDDTNTYITSIDGAIDITGQSNGTGDDNYGISLIDGGYISSTGTGANAATITLDGTGGNGNTANRGISLNKDVAASAASHITSVDGDISLTGVGQGDGHNNYGISIFRNSYITSTGTTTDAATITLHGTAGGAGGTFENDGVRLRGVNDGTATISSVMGDISITGIGGDGTYSNRGFYLADSAAVISTGTGANAATITIDGTGGAGGDTNHGVQIDAAGGATTYITSVDGDIDITGQGGSSGAGSSDSNYGIYLYQGAYITSTGTTTDAATITLDGTGGGGYFDNDGIRIRGDGTSTHITSDMGNISLTGQGGSNGSAGSYGNRGIIIYQDAQIISTGTGANAATITLDGTGGAGENTNHGVVINGQSGSNTFITSVDGAIDITGQGGGLGNNNSSTNYGIFIYDGAYISSTGTGVNAATITLSGTGSAGEDTNIGVNIDDDGATNTYISTVDGAIDITAQGGSNGTGGSNYNYGMRLGDGAYITSTGGGVTAGTITIDATAGAGQANNYGLIMNGGGAGSASISSARGAVDITGESAGNGTGNYAVYVLGGADFDMNGSASLTITANGTASGSTNTDAFRMETSGTAITLEDGDFLLTATILSNDVNDDAILTFDGTTIESTGTGNITLRAINANSGRSLNINSTLHQSGTGNITVIGDDLAVSSTADIMTASGDITIAPHTDSTTIGLGTTAAGDLHLDDDELTYIDAGDTLIIGTSGTGTGTMDLDTWDLSATTYDVELYGGAINIGGITLGTGGLLAHAQDDQDLTVSASITKALAGTSLVDLRADDHIDINADISATSGDINVIINSDRDADMVGGIAVSGTANILTNGGYVVLGGGSGDVGGTNGILGDGDGTGADDTYAYGSNNKFGINVSGSIATDDGDIFMNGHGKVAGNENWANGIVIGGNVFTDNGNITIKAKADDNKTGVGEAGINMNNGGYIESTGTGDIYIYAESSANGGSSSAGLRLIHADTHIGVNDGDLVIDLYSDNTNAATLFFDNSVTNGLRSTGDGNITVTTMGSSGNRNISAETLIGGSGMNGDIILNIDNIGLLQDTYSLQTNGDIYILPYTDSTTIGIGTGATGDLNFNDAELGRISAGGKLVIGNSGTGTGAVDVDSWDLSGFTYDVELYGGAIDMGGITLGTGTLTAHAQNDQDLTLSAAIGKTLAGASTLDLRADKDILVNNNITASTGSLDVILNADRDADQSGGILIDTAIITTNGGDVTAGGGTTPATTAAWGTNDTNKNGITMLASNIASGAGNITLTGHGMNGTSDYQNGITIGDGSALSSTTGSITLIGTGNSGNSDYNIGIRIYGTTGTVTITSDEGDISLTGTGGSDGTAGSNNNYGIVMEDDVQITSTGTGATAGTITLDGTGGDGEDNNHGIYMDGNGGINTYITSVDGAITITGQGGSNGITGSQYNYGIYLFANAYISSTGTGTDAATITLNGTGGNGEDYNYGIHMNANGGSGTYITSVDGDMAIIGQGGSNGNAGSDDNYGIRLTSDTYIASTGTTTDAATITLDGTGGDGEDDNYGVALIGSGTSGAYITSAYGAVDIAGQGGSNGTADSQYNTGIYLYNGAYVESTGSGTNAATLTLNGTGGDGYVSNYGVFLNGSHITSADGTIDITGQGGSNGSGGYGYGIHFSNSSYVESTGTDSNAATITLNGTAGPGGSSNTRGVYLTGAYITSAYGNINVTGQGGNDTSDGSIGIYMQNNAYIESTGTGTGAATITLNGTGDGHHVVNHGVLLRDAYITSIDGAIDITGQGGYGGYGNHGILLDDGAYIESTGTGATAATITLTGTGSVGTDRDYGIYLDGSGTADVYITSVDGAIDITGYGDSTGSSGNDDNYGIYLYDGAYITSTGTGTDAATITLDGTGGNGEDTNYGIFIDGNGGTNTYVTSIDGAISMTGQGGSNGNSGSNANYGIFMYNGGYIESTGTGADAATITLTGTGADGENFNHGIYIRDNGNANTYITSIDGAIDITGQGGSTGSTDSDENQGILLYNGSYIASTGTTTDAATITLTGTSGAGESINTGIRLDGNNTSTSITSAYGAITLTGTGASNGSATSNSNRGIVLYNGGNIQSTGSGENAATITLIGTGATNSDNSNAGVYMDANGANLTNITSVDGAIAITGTGGSSGANGSNQNDGIDLTDGSRIISTGTGANAATITLNGTGGAGEDQNYGVLIRSATSYITSVDGAINITGTGASNGTSGSGQNYGVYLYNGSYIESTGTTTDAATITLDGTGGAGEDQNFGIALDGSGTTGVYITSAYGAIDMTGTAGSTGTNASSGNRGINITDDVHITSTGTGINAATITLNGTGGDGEDNNFGVFLDGLAATDTYISSIDGDITITGQGGSNGTDGSDYNKGIDIRDGARIISTGTGTNAANITLNGTAAAGHSDNYGVHLDGFDGTDTFITSVDGNIDITGQGASNGASDSNNNYGIFIYEGAYIQSTGTGTDAGTITLDGTGGNGGRANRGILLGKSTGVTNTSYITSVDGNINITGTGNGNNNKNSGISMSRDAYITSTGTSTDAATITITATGANGTTENDGLRMNGASEGTSTISSVIGDINITAQAGSDGSSNNNIGLYMLDDAVITSTGTGANAATITINATGGAGDISNHGIYLDGNGGTNTYITSIDGAIDMTGTGASNGAGSSTDNYGIYIYDGAYIESTGTGTDAATITLDGTGGAGKKFNHGILIDGNSNTATRITSVDGAIDMTGQGGSNGASNSSANRGIHMAGGASITSTGTTTDAATITLDGTGGAGGEEFNHGITVKDTNSLISSVIGAIDITGQGGGDGSDGSTGNFGVNIHTSARVTSTGTGANAATITITGTGGSGSSSNHGIWFGSSGLITSVDGDIALTGTGQSNGNSGANYGMQITGGARIRSTGTGSNAASITLDGTGGDGISNNYGVYIVGSSPTYITSIDGDISITGQGGSTGTDVSYNNHGILLYDGAYIESTGTGTDAATITLNGTGGNGEDLNHGVYLRGNTTPEITSVDGAIDITGQGGSNGTSGSNNNFGIYAYDGAHIKSTGTGTDAATITLNGTGGNGEDGNSGIYINDSGSNDTYITSVDGAIDMTGQGGSNGSETSDFNYGVYIYNGAYIESTGTTTDAATITINGTGGNGETVNVGVRIAGGSGATALVTSAYGDIDITGQGGSNGSAGSNNNRGVFVYDGGQITSTGTGTSAATITLNGTGGAGEDTNHGVYLYDNGNSNTFITSVDGAIDITGQGNSNGIAGSNQNHGILLISGAYISSTGTTADAATITLNGTGGNGTTSNNGISLSTSSSVTSAQGDITVIATTTDDTGYAVNIDATSVISTTAGTTDITITATNEDIALAGNITATGDVAITTPATIIYGGGTWTGGTLTVNTGDMTGGPALANISTLDYTTGGAFGLTNAGNLSITNGVSTGAGSVDIATTAGDIDITSGLTLFGDTTITAGGESDITTTGALTSDDTAASALTFTAGGSFFFSAGDITNSNAAELDVTIHADSNSSESGAIALPNITITTNGGDVVMGGGADATTNAAWGTASNIAGIELNGTTINTGAGTITLTGHGDDESAVSNQHGVYLINGATLTSTTGTITVNGTGGAGEDENRGVSINDSYMTTIDGAIAITGTGGSNGTADSSDNGGVLIYNSGYISSTGSGENAATITLNGTGADGDDNNYGIYVAGIGVLTSTDGDITLTGQGGSNGLTGSDNNHGIYLQIRKGVRSLGTDANAANITLNGTSGAGTDKNYGVYVKGPNAYAENDIVSDAGDITITGTSLGTGQYNYGFYISTKADIGSTGNGNITITGTGGTGTINNFGVYLYGESTGLHTTDGALLITGQGGSDGSGNNNQGITLSSATVTSSGTGTITLNGTGGEGEDYNYGVHLGGGYITSVYGAIDITGQGGSNETSGSTVNHGIFISQGALIESTGTTSDAATITLNGSGGDGSNNNFGIQVLGTNSRISSVNGAIDITGQGGTSSLTNSAQGYGISIYNGAYIESTGTGADAATITLNGTGGDGLAGNYGIRLVNGHITSVDGAIDITGQGNSDNTDSSNNNHGIYIDDNAYISSTGTGTNAATITLNGTSGSGGDYNQAVRINNSHISSIDGDIDITGQGNSNGANDSDYNYGIILYGDGYIESTGTGVNAAHITLDGTGGNGGSYNYGVRINGNNTYITTVDGAIDIIGTGHGSGTNNNGIYIYDGAYITSTGATTADISLRGTAGPNSTDILIDTSATLSSAGDLDLTQNTLDLTAGALSAADDINITTRTAGAGIGLGGGAGILNITDAEIALIDAGDTLRINGNADVNIDSLNTTGSSQNLSISGATVTGVGGVQSGGTLRINAKTGNLKLSGPIAATGTGRTLTLASQKRDVLMNGATVNTGAGFAAIYASSPLSSHFGGFVTSYDIKYGIAYDTFTGTGNTLLYRTSDIDTRPILRNLLVQAGTTGHGSLNSFDNQTQHPTLKHYESDKVVDTTVTQGKAGEFVILNTDAINTDKTPAQENAALTPQSGDDMLAPTPNTAEVQINTCTGSDDNASGQCSSTGSQGGA